MYHYLRPILFKIDPETIHQATINLLNLIGRYPLLTKITRSYFSVPDHPVSLFGMEFPNIVGLAAGYDKDGLAWRGLACLGFGHIEIGTVTPMQQQGNPRPRIFRLIQDQSLINRMGFPSKGSDLVAKHLQGNPTSGVKIGINLGKNMTTPLERAAEDYRTLVQTFTPLVDFITINVSSPNTVGLRRLQTKDALAGLLSEIKNASVTLKSRSGRDIPILVKLAPDLSDIELEDAITTLIENEMDGVIATNTTISRSGATSSVSGETGGMSGALLRDMSTRMISKIYGMTGGNLPIIGVGGIMNPDDAQKKIDAGASLIQIYTGLVYRGPRLVGEIIKGIN